MTMPQRFTQLIGGLLLFGFTMALLVESGLGLFPWDVFHQGLAHHLPLTIGQVVIGVGALVLVLWIPLRQKPGVGTLLNVVLVGLALDAGVALLPTARDLPDQLAFLVLGVVGNGIAGAMYIGARLGTGPRDGLWLGIAERTGLSGRLVRTFVEVTAVVVGFALGGTVGVGTVAYALAIGPLVHAFGPRFDADRPRPQAWSAPPIAYAIWLHDHPVRNLVP